MGLESLGYTIRVAGDGLSGLDAAVAFRPHVALIDLALPMIDGWEFGRRLHDNALFDHSRLVAVTGFGSLEHRLRSLAAGFEHHLVKPVKLAELRAVLDGGSGCSERRITESRA